MEEKMSEMIKTKRQRRTLRSAGAVLAGFVAIVVISVATDMIMHATGVFPPPGRPMSNALWLLATAYRIIYGVVGGYITARFAPDRPMRHAMALGVVGLALSIVGAVATWNGGPGASLVSARARRHRNSLRMAGRQTTPRVAFSSAPFLSADGAEFWLSDESPEHGNFSPESLGGGSVRLVLTVPDPDAMFAKAIAAGALEVVAVNDDYGWRLGRVVDPFGHHWEIGRPLS
jgi:uncharacterized glyoxalase superfamily protein PhnB